MPVVAGLYVRRVGHAGGAGRHRARGIAVMVAVHLATGGRGFGIVTPALAGILASVLAGCAVLALRRRPAAL